MEIEPLASENTCILMLYHSIGFVNLFRSHTISENIKAQLLSDDQNCRRS